VNFAKKSAAALLLACLSLHVYASDTNSCPSIRSNSSDVRAFERLSGVTLTVDSKVRFVDPTSFVSVFNYTKQAQKAWPAAYGIVAGFDLPKNQYLSMAFTPSALPDPLVQRVYGQYSVGESLFSVPVAMTISTACGDFSKPSASGSSVVPGCYVARARPDMGIIWRNSGSCVLHNGQQYFLNVIAADISGISPGSGAAVSRSCLTRSCTVPIQNGPGRWR